MRAGLCVCFVHWRMPSPKISVQHIAGTHLLTKKMNGSPRATDLLKTLQTAIILWLEEVWRFIFIEGKNFFKGEITEGDSRWTISEISQRLRLNEFLDAMWLRITQVWDNCLFCHSLRAKRENVHSIYSFIHHSFSYWTKYWLNPSIQPALL